jgi:hypothetical protein
MEGLVAMRMNANRVSVRSELHARYVGPHRARPAGPRARRQKACDESLDLTPPQRQDHDHHSHDKDGGDNKLERPKLWHNGEPTTLRMVGQLTAEMPKGKRKRSAQTSQQHLTSTKDQ